MHHAKHQAAMRASLTSGLREKHSWWSPRPRTLSHRATELRSQLTSPPRIAVGVAEVGRSQLQRRRSGSDGTGSARSRRAGLGRRAAQAAPKNAQTRSKRQLPEPLHILIDGVGREAAVRDIARQAGHCGRPEDGAEGNVGAECEEIVASDTGIGD